MIHRTYEVCQALATRWVGYEPHCLSGVLQVRSQPWNSVQLLDPSQVENLTLTKTITYMQLGGPVKPFHVSYVVLER